MDVESVSDSGAYRKAWFKSIFAFAQTVPDSPLKKYSSEKILWYFDCTQKTSTAVVSAKYDDAMRVVDSVSLKFNTADMTDVVPDSVGETMMRHACGVKRQPSAAQIRALDRLIRPPEK